MSTEQPNHPFNVLSEPDIVQKLPYWFGPDIDALEINLSDSTNGKRIQLPGRGRYCDHIDIVDVSNSTRATESGEIDWMCPVCGHEYSFTDDIMVDELLLNIIKELDDEDTEETVRAINLNIDGTWSHISQDPEDRLPMLRKKRARISLDEAKAYVDVKLPVDIEDSSASDIEEAVIDLDSD
jgi:hypothetical protein